MVTLVVNAVTKIACKFIRGELKYAMAKNAAAPFRWFPLKNQIK